MRGNEGNWGAPPPAIAPRQRLARGSAEHIGVPLSAEVGEVHRITSSLRGPLDMLEHAVRLLRDEPPSRAASIAALHESLRAIERLTSELRAALSRIPTGGTAATPSLRRSSLLYGASVLLADEDPSQLLATSRILCGEGVNVVTALSAPECVVRVAAQRPEVVLADLALGMSLARMLGSVAPQCPLIVTTPVELARSPEAKELVAAGAELLMTPFEAEELLLALEAALMSPRTRPSR